jgi:hypothetical protein
MSCKVNPQSAKLAAYLKSKGFRVIDASGPNGTYKNLLDFDAKTLGRQRLSHRVTADAIGAEGQDGFD